MRNQKVSREEVLKTYQDTPCTISVQNKDGLYRDYRHDTLKAGLMQAMVSKGCNWILIVKVKANHHVITYMMKSEDPNTFLLTAQVNEDAPGGTMVDSMGRHRGLFGDL